MALRTCPECGQKVSDTANTCPMCGFAIKHYYDNEAEQNRLKNKLKSDYEAELRQIEGYYPRRPYYWAILFDEKHNGAFAIGLAIFSTFIIVSCIAMIVLGIMTIPYFLLFLLGIFLFILSILGGIYAAYVDCKKGIEIYNEEMKDLEAVKSNKKKELLAKYNKEYKKIELTDYVQQREVKQQLEKERLEKQIKCPVCGSINVRPISTASRAVSVAAVGLASSKIGKQYECLKCKHKW